MSESEREPLRMVIGAEITAVCIDCGEEFTGTVGLRFIETPEGPGIEVCVCAAYQAHAIARIQRELIPVVEVTEVGEDP